VGVQCDALNSIQIDTAGCVPLTSNLKWERAPGNVRLSAAATALPKDSVTNVALAAKPIELPTLSRLETHKVCTVTSTSGALDFVM
jgi:hypothetical protein